MVWKNVIGYEGIYEVSECGVVRTKEGKTTFTERHGERLWKQRILKQKASKDKTCRVSLWNKGKERTWLVHRLVAKAFIQKVKGKEHINHKDGSRLNNHADNLEWCTYKENSNHAFDTGLMTTNKTIVLVDKETKESRYFRSLSKASEYLGKNTGYLSDRIKKGQHTLESHEIYKSIS